MKKTATLLVAALGIALGALRWADLLLWQDAATGFATAYGSGARLLLALLPAALLVALGFWLFSNKDKPQNPETEATFDAAPAVYLPPRFALIWGISLMLGAALSAFVFGGGATARLSAALWAMAGAWLVFYGKGGKPSLPPVVSVFLLLAPQYWQLLSAFFAQPSSLYRLWPVLRLLAAVAGAGLWVALAKRLYLPGNPAGGRWLWGFALGAFVYAACLALPQLLVPLSQGQKSAAEYTWLVPGALNGLFGLFWALGIAIHSAKDGQALL